MQHRPRSSAPPSARRTGTPVMLLRTVLTLLAAVLVLAGAAIGAPAAAWADTTTGASTTGTASTVSPSTIAVGGTLSYTLSGFPKGSTVQVLVDDGELSAGALVVDEVDVDDRGTTSGRIELPSYVEEGTHWLRFRVSSGEDVPTSQVRTADYTNKSPYFTVAGVTIIGGGGTAAASAGPEPTATASATATVTVPRATLGASAAPTTGAGEGTRSGFPVVGASFLGLAIVLVVLAGFVVRNRRRLAAHQRRLGSSR